MTQKDSYYRIRFNIIPYAKLRGETQAKPIANGQMINVTNVLVWKSKKGVRS